MTKNNKTQIIGIWINIMKQQFQSDEELWEVFLEVQYEDKL